MSVEISGSEQKLDHSKGRNDQKNKNNRYRRDDSKPNISKPERTEKKFFKVNCPYSIIFKKVGREVLGNPLPYK